MVERSSTHARGVTCLRRRIAVPSGCPILSVVPCLLSNFVRLSDTKLRTYDRCFALAFLTARCRSRGSQIRRNTDVTYMCTIHPLHTPACVGGRPRTATTRAARRIGAGYV